MAGAKSTVWRSSLGGYHICRYSTTGPKTKSWGMVREATRVVIDTSAFLAVLFGEVPAPSLRTAFAADQVRMMSAMSVLEATCVAAARRGPVAVSVLSLFLREFRIEVVPFDGPQLELAQSAWLRYGRGFHPARLNFGDCVSYALSRFSGEPLLSIGDDFPQTDLSLVRY